MIMKYMQSRQFLLSMIIFVITTNTSTIQAAATIGSAKTAYNTYQATKAGRSAQAGSTTRYFSSGSSDIYSILGISKNATKAEINAARLKYLQKNHPDKFTNPQDKAKATEDIKTLNDAWDKRNNYDKTSINDKPYTEPEWKNYWQRYKEKLEHATAVIPTAIYATLDKKGPENYFGDDLYNIHGYDIDPTEDTKDVFKSDDKVYNPTTWENIVNYSSNALDATTSLINNNPMTSAAIAAAAIGTGGYFAYQYYYGAPTAEEDNNKDEEDEE